MVIKIWIALVLGVTTFLATVRATYPCCHCGNEIEIFITVQNQLMEPIFEKTTEVEMGQRELIYVLENAANSDGEFRFTSSYGRKGHILETVNGFTAPSGFYWEIRDGEGDLLPIGLSFYVPKNSEVIKISLARLPA